MSVLAFGSFCNTCFPTNTNENYALAYTKKSKKIIQPLWIMLRKFYFIVLDV